MNSPNHSNNSKKIDSIDMQSPDNPKWEGSLNPELLDITATRSSGNGGQNVNKVSTKAIVKFDLLNYQDLSLRERTKVLEYVKTHKPSFIVQETFILISCQETRSFHTNRQRAILELEKLITKALTPVKKRIPTKKPKSADLSRLSEKKHTKDKKSNREKAKGFE